MSENIITNDYIEAFGAIESDPDIRDYRIAKTTIREAKTTFPTSFELDMPPVKNQGSIGACVANSLATTIEYFNKIQHNSEDSMSVGYIYGNRGILDGQSSGMVTRLAIATVCAEGDVSEEMFPFNEEVPDIIEKVKAAKDNLEESAAKFRFTSYFKVKSKDEIKTALMKSGPVVIAVNWYKGMKVEDGVLTSDFKEKSGGHCMVLYGWVERGWKVQNSWGSHWGDNGRFIWPYEYEIREAYSVVDEFVSNLDIKRPFKAKTEFGKFLVRCLNKIYCFFYRIWYNANH